MAPPQQRMDDVRAVMDAVGMERAALLGVSEGGPLTAMFAATHPERCRALVLYGTFARFASWIPTDEAFEALMQYIDRDWGSGGSLPQFAPVLVPGTVKDLVAGSGLVFEDRGVQALKGVPGDWRIYAVPTA